MFKHRIRLAKIFSDLYSPAKLACRTSQTRRHYRLSLGNLDDFLGRPARIADLTDQNVSGMLARLVDDGRSVVTANNRRDYLLAFWRWLAKHGHINCWPDVERLPEPQTIPRAWTQQELTLLLASCEARQGHIAGVKASDWWTAIHGVWWDTGERTGATLDIRLDDYNPATGELYVPAEVRKTNDDAMYVLTDVTREVLARMLTPQRELLFELPGCLGTFYNHYTRLLKDAGLPHGRRNKPQKMRRSFASHLEAAGGNATEALRHSSRRVTEKSYIDPSVVAKPPPNRLLFRIVE